VNSTSCEIPYYVIFSDPMLSHLSFTRSVQVKIFWVVTPCGVVVGYQRFGGPLCLHLQGEDGGSVDLWNFGILPQHYTASLSRIHRLKTSACKTQNSLRSPVWNANWVLWSTSQRYLCGLVLNA